MRKACSEVAHKLGTCGTGTLPPEYAALTNTQILHLAGNLLTGCIPKAYFSASAYGFSSFLYLYMNNLSGPLPAITTNCPLCNRRMTLPGSFNGDPGSGSGLVLEPMRAGFGAQCFRVEEIIPVPDSLRTADFGISGYVAYICYLQIQHIQRSAPQGSLGPRNVGLKACSQKLLLIVA